MLATRRVNQRLRLPFNQGKKHPDACHESERRVNCHDLFSKLTLGQCSSGGGKAQCDCTADANSPEEALLPSVHGENLQLSLIPWHGNRSGTRRDCLPLSSGLSSG